MAHHFRHDWLLLQVIRFQTEAMSAGVSSIEVIRPASVQVSIYQTTGQTATVKAALQCLPVGDMRRVACRLDRRAGAGTYRLRADVIARQAGRSPC
jgi:hypothetical protein